ncbi:M56 family metallopeptidase [Calidifontibacter indicus]|uniref:M56 family metallopeptidase n=1 Tax=Calidifontibacter indicus TaxID=419650 RepID=UPI003D76089A
MYVAALILLAVLLAWPVPRLLPRVTALRAAPAAAILLWQCVSLAAIAAGLLAAPLAVLIQARATSGRHDPEPGQHFPLLVAGLAVTAFVAGRLLLKAHLVGTDLRRGRKEHTELVDLIGVDDAVLGEHVKVLTHPTPTAYCVPGSRKRVVLTKGTLDALDADQLAAVLAHERAHLRQRHDLVLEFFTVLHTAVPTWIRSTAGMGEVKLLIELLADRWAATVVGRRPLATAMLALVSGSHPTSALGAGDDAVIRIEVLAADGRHRLRVCLLAVLASVVVLQLPIALAVLTIVA